MAQIPGRDSEGQRNAEWAHPPVGTRSRDVHPGRRNYSFDPEVGNLSAVWAVS